ncbi:SUMF1/EgtB/PvdO family nonheme iron enzyme [Rhizobiales bacterium 3FA27D7]|uniref:SUMF1/EgtB/PvdO family nonheme iron enzyme n=1 Tax=Mesorhizobium sp. 2RAF21 TaxID=3232995 RepID=UPI0010F92272
MKARVPATIAFVATALAAATSGLSIVRHPGRAQIAAKLAPVETIAIVPGEFTFRLPGEYLRNGRPVDAPTRTVRFRAGFEVMKYQVSAGDYGRCVADGACETPDGNAAGDTPVTGVSYRDAQAYAAWLSGRTGEPWRLPSDEEWSFAAAERLHDDALGLIDDGNPATRWLARYRSEAAGKAERDPRPEPRGHFGANSKGVFDIAGNVWEWTSTCYMSAGLRADATVEQSVENCGVRVADGRHRGYMSTFIRDGKSGGCAAGLAPDNLGIRLVRDPPSSMAVLKWLRAKRAG